MKKKIQKKIKNIYIHGDAWRFLLLIPQIASPHTHLKDALMRREFYGGLARCHVRHEAECSHLSDDDQQDGRGKVQELGNHGFGFVAALLRACGDLFSLSSTG